MKKPQLMMMCTVLRRVLDSSTGAAQKASSKYSGISYIESSVLFDASYSLHDAAS
jgi:hypothetical protein